MTLSVPLRNSQLESFNHNLQPMAGLSVPGNPPLVPKIGYSYLVLGKHLTPGCQADEEIATRASAGRFRR
jgi:hypothetical protein